MRHVAVVLRSLSAVGLLIGFTFSCGNDTDPGDEDTSNGSGGTDSAGGNGGTAPTSNTAAGPGGSGGSSSGGNNTTGGMTTGAGATGAGGNTVNTSASTTGEAGASNLPEETPGLAEACGSDDDCEGDLICIAADSNSLLVGGPANGLCTSPCDEENPCALDAACIIFDSDSYCMPLCTNNDGVQDCAGRDDAVCDVIGVELSCTDDPDCPAPTYCLGGQCVLPICLPKCSVDSDCPEGRYCHPGYGECVDEEPAGAGLNELCDPEGGAEECRGFCAGDDAETARCLETCAFGVYPACGSESQDNGTAACLDAYLGGDAGDLGLCVGLCDCNSDCPDEGMLCISFESIEEFGETEVEGRVGFCAVAPEDPEELEDVVVLTCEE